MLTHRENYFRSVRFETPAYVHSGVGVLTAAWHRHGQALSDLFVKYLGWTPYRADDPAFHPDPADVDAQGNYYRRYTDEWGCTVEERAFGIHGIITGHPLADWNAFTAYRAPATHEPATDFAREQAHIARQKREGAVVLLEFLRLFERMQWVRGETELFMDFADDADRLQPLADLIVDHNLARIRRAIALGADGVCFSDDWGSQCALLIRPDLWRAFFKPLYRRMFQPLKAAGLLIYFHSDGYIMDIVPDLKDAGVDVLNPQTNCQSIEALGALCRDLRLCVSADIDRQGALAFGAPGDVRAYFDRVAQGIGGPDGGLMFQVEIGPDTPLANAAAALESVKRYGTPKGRP